MKKLTTVLIAISVNALFSAASSATENWPRFRGPEGTGVVTGTTELPDTWSASENVAWKTDLPGRGWSSPVVWGNQIFLTTVVNLGDSEAPKKGLYFGGNRPDPPPSIHQWIVVCLDLESGQEIWKRTLHEARPLTAIHLKNSFASETPVTDGEHLYVLFGAVGAYCLDFDGNTVWSLPIKARETRYGWGTSASPVLDGDRIYLVNDNDEDSYLQALNKRTGEEIWRVQRDEASNWASPFVWKNENRTEIVTPGSGRVRSYDIDGRELWSLEGMSSITIATPYQDNELLYISSGYVGDKDRPLYAIRRGGEGDISLAGFETSNKSIAWCQPTAAPYNPSTIVYGGILYVLHDQGFLAAYDATTGTEIYSKQRIPRGGAFTSSPWAYDGKIFCLNEDGETFVFNAGREFVLSHVNKLAADDMSMATPAIASNCLLIRTAARLYCIKK